MVGKRNRLLVPEAKEQVDKLKQRVIEKQGYQVSNEEDIKYEIAKAENIPLQKGYNGTLTSKQAGQIGGKIGGSMVKEMIAMAQNQMGKNK